MANSDSRKVETEARDDASRARLDRAYRSWWSELCRVVERQFGSGPPDPEEAVQSAFERFAKHENPGSVANVRAYLHAASRNYVLDWKRRAAVRRSVQGTIDVIEGSGAPAEIDSERVLIAKERLSLVDAAVRSMEPKRREVLLMHSVHGLPYSEIARRLALSETRVRQLMASALAHCAAAVGDDEEGDDERGDENRSGTDGRDARGSDTAGGTDTDGAGDSK